MAKKTLRDLLPGLPLSDTDIFISRQGLDIEDKKVTSTQIKDYVLADSQAIKTSYESNPDTNAFTDIEKAKLAGIEDNADVTDSINVDNAGAVMESDYSLDNSILKADLTGLPSALQVPPSTILGRNVTGGINPLTVPEAQALLEIQITKEYITQFVPIISGGSFVFNHNLGVQPVLIQPVLQCLIADRGYAVGDMVYLYSQVDGTRRGVVTVADTNNLFIRFGSRSTAFRILRKNNGNASAIVNSRWQIRFHIFG